jgi:hypothetical protein
MKIVEWNIETSMQGADWSGSFTVEDDATNDDIDALVREEVFNIVSWGWSFKEDTQTPQESASE